MPPIERPETRKEGPRLRPLFPSSGWYYFEVSVSVIFEV